MAVIQTEASREKQDASKKKDRRGCEDRRKMVTPEYFLKGGKERRSGKERRYVWYMTM